MSVETSKTSIRTPLARVRGLGSAKSGTSDFFRQRVTAVAMVLLFIPVIVVILSLLGRNQAGAAQILGSPLVAVIMILFIIASVWHMKIGMQVVIEDYITGDALRIASILLVKGLSVLLALACIISVLRLGL